MEKPKANRRPQIIETLKLPKKLKLAGRSLYSHAEFRAMIASSKSVKGAQIEITDPPCGNCVKHMGIFGITDVFFHESGFGNAFFSENEASFNAFSLLIAKVMGIKMHVLSDGIQRPIDVFNVEASANIRYVSDDREVASIPVEGHGNVQATAQEFSRDPIISGKYHSKIDALYVALAIINHKRLTIDPSRPVMLKRWPLNSRVFVDGLEAGLSRYTITHHSEKPSWANDLPNIGISVHSPL